MSLSERNIFIQLQTPYSSHSIPASSGYSAQTCAPAYLAAIPLLPVLSSRRRSQTGQYLEGTGRLKLSQTPPSIHIQRSCRGRRSCLYSCTLPSLSTTWLDI